MQLKIVYNEKCDFGLDIENTVTLDGHAGRVTCLLYPYQLHTRYDPAQLVSGGADFTLCLWNISSGTLLQKFCVQVGEIAQLLVPPANSSVICVFHQIVNKDKHKYLNLFSHAFYSASVVLPKTILFHSSV